MTNVIELTSKLRTRKCSVCKGKGTFYQQEDALTPGGDMFCVHCKGTGIEPFNLPQLERIEKKQADTILGKEVLDAILVYLKSVLMLYNTNELLDAYKLQALIETIEEYRINHYGKKV